MDHSEYPGGEDGFLIDGTSKHFTKYLTNPRLAQEYKGVNFRAMLRKYRNEEDGEEYINRLV